MLFDDPVEEYLSQIKAFSKQYIPSSVLLVNYIRLSRISARVEITKNLFVDLYFNSASGRKDFSLIKGGKRILGWDNLGGWHKHPFDSPNKHTKCKEPRIDAVFNEIKQIIRAGNPC